MEQRRRYLVHLNQKDKDWLKSHGSTHDTINRWLVVASESDFEHLVDQLDFEHADECSSCRRDIGLLLHTANRRFDFQDLSLDDEAYLADLLEESPQVATSRGLAPLKTTWPIRLRYHVLFNPRNLALEADT